MTDPLQINQATLAAPFPWFGGKSRIAPLIWQRFGDIGNYVEPFYGSGAVLLARPQPFGGPETINDADGFVANFWRSILHDPDATAHHADWPVNECDLHARHLWLIERRTDLTARLMADPDYHDPQIAGYWVWGICSWIGAGWCSGEGPWQAIDGKLTDTRQPPHLGNAGMGINRQLPHLAAGKGVNNQRNSANLAATFRTLAERLRGVRVCCGDWTRVTGDSVTIKHAGITGILLDPPYADTANRDSDLYAVDSLSVAHQVREWAIANADHPRLRIALCGYAGEHAMPDTWTGVAWKAQGGYGSQGQTTGRDNAARERVWFSPACLGDSAPRQTSLFDVEAVA